MTTHPPTAEVPLPDWMPDEATMNRLAGEFFAALPAASAGADHAAGRGREPVPGSAAPQSISGAQPAGLPIPGPVPPGLPATDPFAPGAPAPDPFAIGLPAPGGAPDPGTMLTAPRPDGPGVPPPTPVSVPSSPFYFLGESSAYRPGADSGGPLQTDLPIGTPTNSNLTSVLPSVFAMPAMPFQVEVPTIETASAPAAASPAPPAHGFYFLDRPTTEALEPAPAGNDGPAFDRHPQLDVHAIRRDFPILSERVNGRPLIWLDNAATTQKPQAVIDRLAYFYAHENSNIHRAAHELAARATDAYEGARSKVARFLGAGSKDDIIFVRGATEAINLVAQAWGRKNIGAGDEIIISHLEHHANIVPWQMLASEKGARIKVVPVDDTGQILLGEYTKLLSDRTKIVSMTQVSNALGTVTPARQVVELGHRAGAKVLIDGAQSVPHLRVHLQDLGADFFVFSGHKIFGPTGIGVLYGTPEVLADMPPWQGGGNMIADVTLERAVYQGPPNRFEAGTGNIADAVGLGAALDYVDRIGLENIQAYEHQLLEYATPRMLDVPGLRLIGTATDKASVLSFVLDGYRTEEVGTALNQDGIAVRAGHHCAQPILRRFGLEATVRPSLAVYNTCAEIDEMVAALHKLSADRGRR